MVATNPDLEMSRYYQTLDNEHFDYQLFELDGDSRALLRGPAPDRSRPYIVCLGAAQTFGRFCHKPFPQLLSEQLGMQVLNLGIGGAGPRAFLKPHYLEWLNGAEAVVVQVLSGRSESNSLFDNSLRGGLRGVRLSDGVEMRYEQFLTELISDASVQLVEQVVHETRENYVQNMIRLLDEIRKPKILLWLSGRSPAYVPDFRSAPRTLGGFPQLVDEAMIVRIRPHADLYAECISSRGMPQKLWPARQPIDGAVLNGGYLYNHYYPTPEMHAQAASVLTAACRALLPTMADGQDVEVQSSNVKKPTRFVIVCAERTGSNLLSSILDSHPDCLTASELFNPGVLERGDVPGLPSAERTHLNALRRVDVGAFMEEVFGGKERQGYEAIGFKLMYGHGVANSSVLDWLARDPELRVIHLRRRNLLQRFASFKQAEQSGVWAWSVGAKRIEMPVVNLDFTDMVRDFLRVEERDARLVELFARHAVVNVFYEDLAEAPVDVGRQVAAFLGLRADVPLRGAFQKTGSESMRDSVSNYADLKKRLLNWASFFDD